LVRAVLLLALVGAFAAFWATGGFDALSREGGVRELVGSGPTAGVIYVVAFSVLGGLIVPGLVFTIAAPVVFHPWVAFGLSMLGGFGSCIVGFAAARYFAHDWAQQHLPAKLRDLDARLEGSGFVATLLVRLGLYIIPPTHWAFGISRIRWAPYLAASTIGIVPWTIGATFGTTALLHWMENQPPWVWIVLLAIVPLGIWWRSRSLGNGGPPSATS
jgi:uncharacterized membrane protein YdjX (TVP38/TMEM64 family)